jgi:DNA-binding NtrC family response regulator
MEDVDIEHNMVGESPAMQRVYHFIKKVSPTDSTVLIEVKAGQERNLRRALFIRNSNRAQKPFIAVNWLR